MIKYKHWLISALLLTPPALLADQCKNLLVSGNPEYPPYLWRSDLDSKGLVGANELLIKRVAQEVGVNVTIEYVGPWGRVQEELAAGRLDALAGAFYTATRAERMDYLYPAFQLTSTSVWVNKRKPFDMKGLESLRGRQGVTVINNSFGQVFDEYARENLTIHQVGSLEQGFRMLEDQRVDYMLYEEAPGFAYVSRMNIDNVITLPYQVSSEFLYITFSKNSACNTPEMRKKFEDALRKAAAEDWMKGYMTDAYQLWKEHLNQQAK